MSSVVLTRPIEAAPPEPYEGMEVTEAQYWQYYYEGTEESWEYNDGRLEEKGVSDWATFRCFDWFIRLLMAYLDSHPIGERVGLEMGFRMSLAGKVKIRKPDYGVVLSDNPVQLVAEDRTYRGIFDLCIEGLSDSDKIQKERDTIQKYGEYAKAGVKEYYILHSDDGERAFYQLGPRGVYVPLPVSHDGVVCSRILPGFQWNLAHLDERPALGDLIDDPVYRGYVLPELQLARTERDAAEARAASERLQRELAEKRAAELLERLKQAGIGDIE